MSPAARLRVRWFRVPVTEQFPQPPYAVTRRRLDRPGRDLECLGDLAFRAARVIAQDDDRPLSRGETLEGGEQVETLLAAHPRGGGRDFRGRIAETFPAPVPPPPGDVGVDHDPAQIGLRTLPDPTPPGHRGQQGGLDEVVGVGRIAGQQVGRPEERVPAGGDELLEPGARVSGAHGASAT